MFWLWSTTQCPLHYKVIRSRTDILISVFTPSIFHFLSKISSASVFFHSHPLFNKMFIVNGKSHCCNDTFTDVWITSLLAKMFKKNTNYFYVVTISILLAILSEIFIQIGYYFQKLCKKTKVDVFF